MEEITQPDISAIVPMEIDSKRKRKKKEGKRSFGLFIIFEKTFRELLSLRRVLSYIGLSIVFPFVFTMIVSGQLTGTLADMNIDFQIATVVNYFAFYSFFWNAGILLILYCGLTASTFISSEESGGTLIFLLTKPIRRTTLYVGKFLGYFVNMAILQFVSLLFGLTITCTLFDVSSAVFIAGLKFLVPIYLYALLMIAVIGLILGFLSIINKRMVISVLVIMFLIIFIYFLGIIFRVAIPTYYESGHLYLIDMGYNLSLIFTTFLGYFGFQPIPFFQQNFGLFFGTYVSMFSDVSEFLGSADPENGLTFLLPETGYINPIVSIIVMVAITALLFILGLIILERKDIGPQ